MEIVSNKQINYVDINYYTDGYTVKCKLEFGKGEDSFKNSDDSRMYYDEKDKFNIDELEFSNGVIGRRVIGYEGPIVCKIYDIEVHNMNESYDYEYEYGIGFAFDKEEPEYYNNLNTEPNNIERDGKMWHVVANDRQINHIDQNAGARYQMILKFAKEELTEEEKDIVEEKTDKTGFFFITIAVCEAKKLRSVTRGGATRGISKGVTRGVTRGATRGGGGEDNYSDGRVAYGNVASTSSSLSNKEYVNVPKLVIPFRFKVKNDSEISDTMGAKDLASAKKVEELQKQYQPVVF